ncbi:polysaccharide export outer membrane protein [Thalassovita litoralis]|jgi:polysaccharide export outer membrane protein|uniref:Polysaccharide export outer membrane protein n=1 Tax=Thalassovita litoralis TaxID=1010611 RepID=A0A521EAJ5_9RHOB|nr:polysaccharide biosynthesis/export family protein [Thalassovita litoralis]SMO80956.1 polysaccharide export outer membrane protein [Thalassovita litoralis]
MKRAVFTIAFMFLAACSDGFTTFPITREQQEQLDENVTIIRLTESNISSYMVSATQPQAAQVLGSSRWEYKLGAGDILHVTVFGHPDLGGVANGSDKPASQTGFTVQSDGRFYYPYIGDVIAANRTVQDVRDDIAGRLAKYVNDPQVEVRVAEYNSQRVFLNGEVKAPNTQRLSVVPLSLLEAVNAAGGLTEDADPGRITIQRNGYIARVDLTGFLERGYRQNNPVLRNGDIVNVPPRRTLEAFLLGEISKPSTVDLSKEPVTLTQALTRQGGLREARADARGVFVFRAAPATTYVYQLETSSPAGLLLGTRFMLEPGDVVYVTRSPLQKWNDTITRILPTVNAVYSVDRIAE